MTITNNTMNRRLESLEQCAECAPRGTYKMAKDVVDLVHETTSEILRAVRDLGLNAPNDDRLRNLEVAIYEYIRADNGTSLATGEGFGSAMDSPTQNAAFFEGLAALYPNGR